MTVTLVTGLDCMSLRLVFKEWFDEWTYCRALFEDGLSGPLLGAEYVLHGREAGVW